MFRFSLPLLLLLSTASLFAQQSYLKTKVNPGRAGVFLDGKYLGPAGNLGFARKYAVEPGEHEVRLVEPRYEEWSGKVTVTAGKTTTLSQTLKKLPVPQPPFGSLRTVDSEKFSAVYINGKYMGHADEFNGGTQRLLLPPGDYDLKIVSTSGKTHEQKIKIEANQTVTVDLTR
ncbi:MAG: PEGA domain-containing protein [Bryobacteraceae bacterium]